MMAPDTKRPRIAVCDVRELRPRKRTDPAYGKSSSPDGAIEWASVVCDSTRAFVAPVILKAGDYF